MQFGKQKENSCRFSGAPLVFPSHGIQRLFLIVWHILKMQSENVVILLKELYTRWIWPVFIKKNSAKAEHQVIYISGKKNMLIQASPWDLVFSPASPIPFQIIGLLFPSAQRKNNKSPMGLFWLHLRDLYVEGGIPVWFFPSFWRNRNGLATSTATLPHFTW